MEAQLTTLTHKIPMQLHLVAEGCTTCSSRSRRPVPRKLRIYETEALKKHEVKGEWKVLHNEEFSDLYTA